MYRYYKEENVIKEVASMEEPSGILNYRSDEEFNNHKFSYKKHIASLKSFPCHESCKELWNDEKEVSEGDDFIFQHKPNGDVKVLPIPETEDEDGLWEEVNRNIFVNTDITIEAIYKITDELKKHYSVKRIKP